jgi:alpha-tubulin suppressor-like RCC1 family protein
MESGEPSLKEINENLQQNTLFGNTCIKQVVQGLSQYTCVLYHDNAIQCMGNNYALQLGLPPSSFFVNTLTTITFQHIEEPVALAAGSFHTCAIYKSHRFSCWGGIQTEVTHLLNPAQNDILELRSIVNGLQHSCLLGVHGEVVCWGNNNKGQLGYGNTNTLSQPVNGTFVNLNLPPNTHVMELHTADYSTCARLDKSPWVRCWGENQYSNLCINSQDTVLSPTTIENIEINTINVTDMSISQRHLCLLYQDGHVACCGQNLNEQVITNSYDMQDKTPIIKVSTQQYCFF